jgi:hypothetical protein
MNKEIGEQWVRDLRSGEFQQTTKVLKNGEGYCCYGVLAEQAVAAGILVREQNENGGWMYYDPADPSDLASGILPYAAWKWAGLENSNPLLPSGDLLTELNDDWTSFDTIADLIDQYL